MGMMVATAISLPRNLFLIGKQEPSLAQTLLLILDCLAVLVIILFPKIIWNFTIGYWGERLVGERLKDLGPKFLVISDLRPKKIAGNIDHVVIGQNGIFAIEAKTIFSLVGYLAG